MFLRRGWQLRIKIYVEITVSRITDQMHTPPSPELPLHPCVSPVETISSLPRCKPFYMWEITFALIRRGRQSPQPACACGRAHKVRLILRALQSPLRLKSFSPRSHQIRAECVQLTIVEHLSSKIASTTGQRPQWRRHWCWRYFLRPLNRCCPSSI